jgi:peptide/nickel transport system permease protein
MRVPYIVNRILQIIPVVFGILIISFLLIHAAPGDPIVMFLGEGAADPVFEAQVRHRLGLDRPLYEQLFYYLQGILAGDLGTSFHQGRSVLALILDRAQPTILLMGFSIAFGTVMGILMGVYAATKPYATRDNVTIVASLIFFSLPNFWLGQMLILIFSVELGLLPAAGMRSFMVAADQYWIDRALHLVLPTITLGSTLGAFVARFVRTSMIEALSQDYILTARAKGLSDHAVFYTHALRNALLPVITYIGLRLGYMLSGAVVIESVFGWPGLGLLMIDALFDRDYPLILGMFIVVSLSVTIVTFLVDILYFYLDPRIRLR